MYAHALDESPVGRSARWIAATGGIWWDLLFFGAGSLFFKGLIWYAVFVATACHAALQLRRVKLLDNAIKKYGADGFLALNLLACPDALRAGRLLKKTRARRHHNS